MTEVVKRKPGRPRKIQTPEAPKAPEFECRFCKRKFTSDERQLLHMCEQGRRFRARNDVCEKQAYQWYARFYEQRMPGRKPNESQFETSDFYLAFVRFSKYLRRIHAINAIGFVDFLISREVRLDEWEKPVLYERYVREWSKSETPTQAMQRNFLLMEQWAIENNEHWTDYFRKVSTARAILYIISGRLSPWILFTASSAQDLLNRFNAEQLTMLEKAVDISFWTHKLKMNEAEVEIIRGVMNEINL